MNSDQAKSSEVGEGCTEVNGKPGRPSPGQPTSLAHWKTPSEVGATLGVSRWTVCRLIARKQLVSVDVGAGETNPVYRIDPASVSAFQERRRRRQGR
jgi:hypothetical protein